MHQYLVVQRRTGYGRSVLIEFREGVPVLVDHDPQIVAPIIPVTYTEFKRQLGIILDERTPRTKKSRNAKYRKSIQARRVSRAERHVSEELRKTITALLREKQTGVAISIATGVSTSFVSELKKKLEQQGEL